MQAPNGASRISAWTRHLICLFAPLLFHPDFLRADFIGNNYAIEIGLNGNADGACGTGNAYGVYGVSYSVSCGSTYQGSTYSGTATSLAPTFGVVETYASLLVTGPGGGEPINAYATTWAFDTWTNTTNEALNVYYTVSVDCGEGVPANVCADASEGSLGLYNSDPSDPDNSVTVSANCGSGGEVHSPTPVGAPTCSSEFTIAADSYADFFFGMSAEITFDDPSLSYFLGTSDYLGSATLTSVVVTDSNGNPVSPSVLESSNGTFLTPTGYESSTPEPSTLALMILAGPVVLLRRVLKTSH
jgi:hypothetical protein